MEYISLLFSLLIGFIIAHFYYKRTQKDSDIQLKTIKSEFKTLNTKVSNIDLSNISGQTKEEILEISDELKSWVEKLNDDPGSIENDINTKINIQTSKDNEKSKLLRTNALDVVNKINEIIISLSENGKGCKWEKPKLPSNVFKESVDNVKIKYKNSTILYFSCNYASVYLNIMLSDKKDYTEDRNSVIFSFRLKSNNEIELYMSTNGIFKFIEEKDDSKYEERELIYKATLKELFGYILVKK